MTRGYTRPVTRSPVPSLVSSQDREHPGHWTTLQSDTAKRTILKEKRRLSTSEQKIKYSFSRPNNMSTDIKVEGFSDVQTKTVDNTDD